MLVIYCWIVYGKWPGHALPPETLSWAYPVGFLCDFAWAAFCAWLDKRWENRQRRKAPWRYYRG